MKLSEAQTNLLAAILGHTNNGHPMPQIEPDTWRDGYAELDDAVSDISGGLFESDEDQESFLAEAQGWVVILRDDYGEDLDRIEKSFPDIAGAMRAWL